MKLTPTVFFPFLFSIVASLFFSGCLKTRAQLKGDDDNSEAPVVHRAEIKDVHPETSAVAVDELKAEFTKLSGRIEELERAQKETGTGRDDVKKLETRIIELEQYQAQMIEAIKRLEDSPKATGAVQADSDATFEKAKKAFEGKDYETATQLFSTYLKNPKAKQAPEAYFLRGEAYFLTKDFKKAIVDFSKFPEKYTKSKHMPHALFRIGQSFDALGMKEDAKSFYQELQDKFPGSAEAKKSRLKGRP